jgi:hypothetical protein
MGQIITEASNLDSAVGILNNPHNKYWDTPPTRREVMGLVSALGKNDEELSNRSDTVFMVVNLLAEKLGVTRGEIDAYVAQKASEVNEWRAKLAASMEEKKTEAL